jgi:hypothetical protein
MKNLLFLVLQIFQHVVIKFFKEGELENSQPATPDNFEPGEKRRAHAHFSCGHGAWIAAGKCCMQQERLSCYLRQLSPCPGKCQLSSRYLAWLSVGRKISDGAERKRLAHLAGTKGILPTKNGSYDPDR